MAAVINSDIPVIQTPVLVVDKVAEAAGNAKPFTAPKDSITILSYHEAFTSLLGTPTHSLLLSTSTSTKNPFFHEACVYLPAHEELYITSNLLQATSSSNLPTILISRIKLSRTDRLSGANDIHTVEWAKMRPPPGIEMPNGGVNYKADSILFCAQGSLTSPGGIWHMPRGGSATPLVTNWYGRDFNSVNDVVVASDGAVWFTDPCYGHEQEFRQRPKVRCQVYRFVPQTGECRVVADGLGRPNGIAFSPDEKVIYITDTDYIHGDGEKDALRAATIYAWDITSMHDAPFLTNKRLFAYAADGFPDGIKCDVHGNVYSGCGDGVEVWNPAGSLIGRIVVPGGCANFCFGREGELFICAERELWRVQLGKDTKGALLGV